ncbi:MAG: TIGR04255 family protein [Pseudolabrys sp.]
MAKKLRRIDPLPKAPLAEVVFELHWALQSGPGGQVVLQSDPGLLPLLDGFTRDIKKAGFGAAKDMSHPLQTGPHGIARRYFTAADAPFPIMQIGPGIFATNESSEYEWKSFKKQIDRGLRVLLAAYPKLGFFKLIPIQIQLRYVDVFGKSVLGNAALFHFIERGTSLKIGLPPMLNNRKLFDANAVGRFVYQSKIKERRETEFQLDMGSGRNNDTKEDIVRMETKIISKNAGVPALNSHSKFLGEISSWLEMAHGITSSLFKELITAEVLRNYRIGN